MPNFIEIGGVTRKPLVDLTWNDPVLAVRIEGREEGVRVNPNIVRIDEHWNLWTVPYPPPDFTPAVTLAGHCRRLE